MKALVLKEYNRLQYEEVADPRIADEDVLLEVKSCGICGSDVHGMDGSTGRRIPPVIMGHEASGVIARVGAAVDGWKPGERVTMDSTVWCGECWYCRRGEVNLCERRRVLGVSCAEYRCSGAFAQYVAVPARILYRIPDQVDFSRAAMVEPLAIAMHAVRLARPEIQETAVVIGAGMIGLMVLQCLKASGCSSVLVADVDPAKLGRARECGADAVLDPAASGFAEVVLSRTSGRGADMAFEAVGVSAAVQSAVGSVRKGGRVALVGNVSPRVELPLQTVVTRQISLLGSCASQGEYPACLSLMASGLLRLDLILSAEAPLSEGAAWFDRLYHRDPSLMKVILKP
ncbi:MAG TPA: galactitol-1-phosphate 5-dehydrogenase [Spirochaetia bacterium]|nr:galactitol-1-phosphate 5-dehydrogenase [Spirochaetia bacterium]